MPITFYGDSVQDGGVGSLGHYNLNMKTTATGTATEYFPSPGSSSADIAYYTVLSQPNTTDWTGGTYNIYANVTLANSLVDIESVELIRYDFAISIVRATKSSGIVTINCGTTGVKNVSISWNDGTQNPSGRASSDRLVARIYFIRNSGHGNQTVGVTSGIDSNTRVETPLTSDLRNLTQTISDSVTLSHDTDRLKHIGRTSTDSVTLTHTSTERAKGFLYIQMTNSWVKILEPKFITDL